MATRKLALPLALIICCLSASSAAMPADVPESARTGPEAYPVPPQSLHAEAAARRHALASKLGPGLVWLPSAPSADLGRFFQADEFYYLSGLEIPEVALAIQVDGAGTIADEVLFLPAHSPHWEMWNGPRLAPGEEAEHSTGFARTAPVDARQAELEALLAVTQPTAPEGDGPSEVVLYALEVPEGLELPEGVRLDTHALGSALSSMRLVKSAYERQCLENAIRITTASFHDAAQQVHPGRYEYQVQAAMEHGFMQRGSERPGFASICGSGGNSTVLHYQVNRRRLEDGDLIVIDVGAKWRYYCADITRTLPVSGKYTPRQREIYDIVLRAQRAAAEAARPGMTIGELDKVARDIIREAGYAKFFPHGLGHWIGLDVHDAGGRAQIPVGALFTIEPGIYIPEEGLGVRIEDDYVMTEEGAVRLSDGFPQDPDEIEAYLAARD